MVDSVALSLRTTTLPKHAVKLGLPIHKVEQESLTSVVSEAEKITRDKAIETRLRRKVTERTILYIAIVVEVEEQERPAFSGAARQTSKNIVSHEM